MDQSFHPAAGDDALQSWKNKYVVVPKSKDPNIYGIDGYRLAVYNDDAVYITDETGWIFRAPMPPSGLGDLGSLPSAKSFPAAQPIDVQGTPVTQSWKDRVKRFWTPAQPRLCIRLLWGRGFMPGMRLRELPHMLRYHELSRQSPSRGMRI